MDGQKNAEKRPKQVGGGGSFDRLGSPPGHDFCCSTVEFLGFCWCWESATTESRGIKSGWTGLTGIGTWVGLLPSGAMRLSLRSVSQPVSKRVGSPIVWYADGQAPRLDYLIHAIQAGPRRDLHFHALHGWKLLQSPARGFLPSMHDRWFLLGVKLLRCVHDRSNCNYRSQRGEGAEKGQNTIISILKYSCSTY